MLAECVSIKASDIPSLKNFALKNNIALTVVGPEQPLVAGIVDEFEAAGLKIFGPSKAASQLEGSKVFAKQFMERHNIPTAGSVAFTKAEYKEAKRFARDALFPLVVKADGLAAGKGVTVCHTRLELSKAIDECLKHGVFADAGASIVIEEFMEGIEASIFVLTDGDHYIILSPAQDHKRIFDNDEGKNTGGMGAYALAPIIGEHNLGQIEKSIIIPTLKGMNSEGIPYRGCLYVGLMMTKTGAKVVEYNCRFGDPETQVILPLLEDDLAKIMLEIANGKLEHTKATLKQQYAVCVVLASGGYPDSYKAGKKISGISKAEQQPNTIVFHAGTTMERNTLVTSGGRVLGVTSLGDTLKETIEQTYQAVEMIQFDDMHFRRDIGRKGLFHI